MFNSGSSRATGSGFGVLLLVVAGLLGIVVSAYLMVNPAALPSVLNLPFVARFVPTLFVGIITLLFPLIALGLALLVMFASTALLEAIRPLFPISPFWVLLVMAMVCLVLQNLRRNRAMPWGIMLTMLSIIALVALYELKSFSLRTHGLLFPLLAGFMLVTALGMLRTAKQITFVVGALIVAFLALELQLLPFLIPSWGSVRGVLREAIPVSSVYQVTALGWLLTSIALFCLGAATCSTGKWRLVLLGLFLLFAVSDLLTFTRGSFVGLGSGLAALLLLNPGGRNRTIGLALLVGLVLFLVARYSGAWTYSTELASFDKELGGYQAGELNRISLLVEGVKQMPAHFILGKGAVGPTEHSAFLAIWNNYGGITAISLWGFLLFLLKHSFRMARAASKEACEPRTKAITVGLYYSFAGALALTLVDTTFFTLVFSVVFWLMRGLEIAIWRSGLVPLPQPTSGRRTRLAAASPGGSISPKDS
jgi:hypothetical protein